STATCAPLQLASFPTRRSSDLPIVDDVQHFLLDDRVIVVEVRLRAVEAMPVIFAGQLIVGPIGRFRVEEDDARVLVELVGTAPQDRKSTRLNSSHVKISYAVFC